MWALLSPPKSSFIKNESPLMDGEGLISPTYLYKKLFHKRILNYTITRKPTVFAPLVLPERGRHNHVSSIVRQMGRKILILVILSESIQILQVSLFHPGVWGGPAPSCSRLLEDTGSLT